MMTSERASIFGDDDLDVSGFTPATRTTRTDKSAIREVAESRGFRNREPAVEQERAGEMMPAPRQQRRHTTGRNRQLNIKATEDTITRFYALADAQKWILGEAFEQAIAALEREITTKASR